MTLPTDLLPSRAHRRFLRQLQPVRVFPHEDYCPLTVLRLCPHLREIIERHLATAGQTCGGSLLGFHREGTVQVTHLLPAGYPPHLPGHDPLELDAGYLLGAIDAARQSSDHAVDWVGNWVMPQHGWTPSLQWCLEITEQARRYALISPEHPLLIIGRAEDSTSLQAYVNDPESLQAVPLAVAWERMNHAQTSR